STRSSARNRAKQATYSHPPPSSRSRNIGTSAPDVAEVDHDVVDTQDVAADANLETDPTQEGLGQQTPAGGQRLEPTPQESAQGGERFEPTPRAQSTQGGERFEPTPQSTQGGERFEPTP